MRMTDQQVQESLRIAELVEAEREKSKLPKGELEATIKKTLRSALKS